MKKWNRFNIADFQQKRFKGYMLPYTSRQNILCNLVVPYTAKTP